MRVSVIVPVKNDAARLRRCLASLRANAAPDAEILVADNGSTDGTPDVARQAGVSVLVLPDLKVSALRNAAARAASGQFLGFVDADHEVAPGWIDAAHQAFDDEGVGASGALYDSPPDGTWVQRMYGALRGTTAGRHETAWLGSGNLVVRRRAFESVGGFDASLEACEDVDLCQRLRSAGFKVIADERFRSVHHGDPPTLVALFRAERWRGRDNLRVSVRGLRSWRDVPSVASPLLTLAALAAVVMSPVIALVSPRAAFSIAIGSAALILILAALRGIRILARLGRWSPLPAIRAMSVGLVYELARAIALVTRAPHHRR